MTVTDYAFIVVAAVTLLGAYRVVTSQKIMHAALWLGLTFMGVAGIFLILGAEFLAAAQVLIYVGAIMTILIFGIMLSPIQELRADGTPVPSGSSPRKGVAAALVGAGFALLMLILFIRTEWSEAGQAVTGVSNPRLLGEAIFGRFVVPFEVASIVLLVALIGAIVLAVREEQPS